MVEVQWWHSKSDYLILLYSFWCHLFEALLSIQSISSPALSEDCSDANQFHQVTHSLTLIHTLTLTHTHTHSLTHSLTHTHSHTHKNKQANKQTNKQTQLICKKPKKRERRKENKKEKEQREGERGEKKSVCSRRVYINITIKWTSFAMLKTLSLNCYSSRKHA